MLAEIVLTIILALLFVGIRRAVCSPVDERLAGYHAAEKARRRRETEKRRRCRAVETDASDHGGSWAAGAAGLGAGALLGSSLHDMTDNDSSGAGTSFNDDDLARGMWDPTSIYYSSMHSLDDASSIGGHGGISGSTWDTDNACGSSFTDDLTFEIAAGIHDDLSSSSCFDDWSSSSSFDDWSSGSSFDDSWSSSTSSWDD